MLKSARYLLLINALPLLALQPPAKAGLAVKETFSPAQINGHTGVPLPAMRAGIANAQAWDRFMAAQGGRAAVHLDPRSGTPLAIIAAIPLVPGNGDGNNLTRAALGKTLGREVQQVDRQLVSAAVRQFIMDNLDLLAIDPAQLGEFVTEPIISDFWQITIPQVYQGIPVRGARLLATVKQGNLILMGTEHWGNVSVNLKPAVTMAMAREIGGNYVGGWKQGDKLWSSPTLEILPFAPVAHPQGRPFAGPVGKGYEHRLVWSFGLQRPPELGRYEFLIDAHSGELLAFEDRNAYLTRQIKGGIYPITSTDVCPSTDLCGTMLPDHPMPWANTGLAAPNDFTNSAGNYDDTAGSASTTLNGKYVRVTDTCGAVNATGGDINLGGVNGQHDCTTPGTGGAGNTPASRSAFYELNKIAELARGFLPANSWLQAQLTSNMNINQTCNAFWDFSTVNFYRSGGGCRNTGEIAAIFDHEWGHGMDDFDSGGALSASSEGYADIVGIYRLQSSCVGYGFFQTIDDGCGLTADGTGFNSQEDQVGTTYCTTNCSGVRDADYLKHSNTTPATPANHFPRCAASSGLCGEQTHCAAGPTRQAAWDLAARDLQGGVFNYDSQRAFLIANKIFYQGSGNIGDWHGCTLGGQDGCPAGSGYMQWLAADDDDGNLSNGTPHMTAIYAAFNRHGIACNTPSPQNGGCSGAPTVAPVLTVAPGSNSNQLSWGAVAGAVKYWVYRGEGNGACNTGKALIATVIAPGVSHTDNQVTNGRTYYYAVVAVGSNDACFGPSSTCTAATPQPCAAAIGLSRPTYNCADSVAITLVDGDFIGAGTRTVQLFSTTEATPENVLLTESPPNSGVFAGSFATGAPPAAGGDSKVSVVHGDTLTARFTDPSYCGTPNVVVTATAVTDCQGPLISGINVTGRTESTATVNWTTSESANSRVTYGTSPPPATNRDDLAVYNAAHALQLTALSACTNYIFSVTSADPAGNSATDNNGGSYHPFTTLGVGYLYGPDPADTNAIWTPTGTAGTIWHRDTCKANSPANAWKAGASAACPGAYGDTADTYLTSTAINLGAAGHGYRLRFWEWLSSESGYDFAHPQISTNGGGAWTDLVIAYAGSSSGWRQQTIDLAAYNGSVLLRFWFHTDGSVTGEGWYVDDIEVSKPQACGAEVQTLSTARTDSCTSGGAGNGNGVVEPGESVVLQVTARNAGSLPATGISAILSTTTPGVIITDNSALFPNLAASASGVSIAPHFSYIVTPAYACGTPISFRLDYAYAGGGFYDTFSTQVGLPGGSTTTLNSTDVPKTIADNATVTSTLAVSGLGTVTDIDLILGNITHTYDGDLDIFLIAPTATTVELTTDNGGGGDNFVNTRFDDEAATLITAGTAPFTGSFRPEGSLATLDGIAANGTWTLRVADDATTDTGSLTAWSLVVSTSGAPVCNACACTPAPAMSTVTQGKSSNNLTQSWPAVAGSAGYRIWRSTTTDPAGWSGGPAATQPTGTTGWIDANQLTSSTSQFYSVTDVNACGNESPK